MVAQHATRVCAVTVAEAKTLGDFFGVVNVCHVAGPEGGDGYIVATLKAECAIEGQGATEVAEVGEEGGEEVF